MVFEILWQFKLIQENATLVEHTVLFTLFRAPHTQLLPNACRYDIQFLVDSFNRIFPIFCLVYLPGPQRWNGHFKSPSEKLNLRTQTEKALIINLDELYIELFLFQKS